MIEATRVTGRRPWWLPYAAGAAASLAALAVMTWQVVVRGSFIALDWPLHEFLAPHVPDGAGKVLLDTLSRPGQRWLTLPLVLAVGAFASWRQWSVRPIFAALVGLGSAFVVGSAIKDGLARTPPYRDIDILHGFGEAFPSGHAANAAFTWAFLTVVLFGARGVWPSRRWLATGLGVSAGLTALTGTVMTVMDYHWITDIPGGVAVGVFALMLAMIALGPPPAFSAQPAVASSGQDERRSSGQDERRQPAKPTSGEDERRRDGGNAVTATGEPEPVAGSAADRDGSANRG